MSAPVYPLSAIVGQEALVEALLVNAVAPDVGGVLVRGERGTAKSTAVRGLAPLLPPVARGRGRAVRLRPRRARARRRGARRCRRSPSAPRPLVELPLGATLDRLVGALDLGRALAGEQAFEPGLLARAHQGILYVDEVNLLPDHLVDALLDAAASAVARVEREAVSAEHDARFILVGTMNVEEGDLRPQLLDRFALGVDVGTPTDPAVRAEIVRRRLAYEQDPAAFCARWADEERALARAHRRRARAAADRPAARARAAADHRRLREARGRRGARRHRQRARRPRPRRPRRRRRGLRGARPPRRRARSRPPPPPRPAGRPHADRRGSRPGARRRARPRRAPAGGPAEPRRPDAARRRPRRANGASTAATETAAPVDAGGEATYAPSAPARPRNDAALPARLDAAVVSLAGAGRGPVGRRARTSGRGAGSIDSRPAGPASDDLALVASLRARLLGDDAHLREHVRSGREGAFLCLVVDASGSMGAQRRLARVKGALAGLLRDAYARRDRVAVVAFRDAAAEVLIAPGAPLERAAAALASLPTGGRTPLAAGLLTAELLVRREALRDPTRRSIAVVLTDGRVQDPDGAIPRAAAALGRAATAVEVVDTEEGPVRVGPRERPRGRAGGRVHRLVPVTAPSRRAA